MLVALAGSRCCAFLALDVSRQQRELLDAISLEQAAQPRSHSVGLRAEKKIEIFAALVRHSK
jgi:hypothetical protein